MVSWLIELFFLNLLNVKEETKQSIYPEFSLRVNVGWRSCVYSTVYYGKAFCLKYPRISALLSTFSNALYFKNYKEEFVRCMIDSRNPPPPQDKSLEKLYVASINWTYIIRDVYT